MSGVFFTKKTRRCVPPPHLPPIEICVYDTSTRCHANIFSGMLNINRNNANVNNGLVINLTTLHAILLIRLIMSTHRFSSLFLQIKQKIKYKQTATLFFPFRSFDVYVKVFRVVFPDDATEYFPNRVESPDGRVFHTPNQIGYYNLLSCHNVIDSNNTGIRLILVSFLKTI